MPKIVDWGDDETISSSFTLTRWQHRALHLLAAQAGYSSASSYLRHVLHMFTDVDSVALDLKTKEAQDKER